jgi:hypothetical protein
VFIVGTSRSGSTALAELVANACGLDLARGKESHFLASAALRRPSGGPDGRRFDRLRAQTKEQFDSLFPPSAAAGTLDASTSSLYYSGSAVQVLDEYFPDARLVAVLRDPVRRAASAHRYMAARGLESLPFADALQAETGRVEAGWSHIWHYARTGLYAHQIESLAHWRDRTLFLLYETDLSDPAGLAERISDHIGHPIVGPVEMSARNQARPFRSPAVGRSVEWLRSSALARRAPEPLRTAGRRVVATLRHAQPDGRAAPREDVGLARLGGFYRDDVERVSDLTQLPVREVWTHV